MALDNPLPLSRSAPARPFVLAAVAGKGLALLATSSIAAGTHLFSEAPILLLTRSSSHALPQAARVLAGFSQLAAVPRAALLALCSNLPAVPAADDECTALAVWKANNFCLDAGGTTNAVFALAARINHACVGGENCRWTWVRNETQGGERGGEIQFWSERDIVVRPGLSMCGCLRGRAGWLAG